MLPAKDVDVDVRLKEPFLIESMLCTVGSSRHTVIWFEKARIWGGGAGLIDHEVVSKATNPNYFFIGESLLNFVPEHGVFFCLV